MLIVPEAEIVIRDLKAIWPIIYSAFDYGTYQTLEFFKERVIDPFLAAHLVRYHAKEALNRDSEGYFKIENVPNSGLFLFNDNYYIRVIKTRWDKLPPPRYSLSRQQYYQQQRPRLSFSPPQACLPLPEFRDYQTGNKLNLIILWDLEPESKYKIGSISLACPKDGGLRQSSVVAFWHRHVPQEFLLGNSDILHPEAAEDLPITFSIDEETGDDF